MNIFRLELKRGMKALLIWAVIIGGMDCFCLFLYPSMKGEIASLENMWKAFGAVGAAFGMDRLNLGSIMGFYGIYAGCMLGIGGLFYAAMLGTGMLAKEEKEHTAEFLLTHPVSRECVFWQKFAAVLAELLLFNVIVTAFSLIAFPAIGEAVDWKVFWLFHGAQVLMQFEMACIGYAISSFLRRDSIGVGLGVAALMYFLGVLSNISEKAEAAKYITPYVYADAAEIIPAGSLDTKLVLLGMAYAVIAVAAAFIQFRRKDIF